MHQAKNSMNMVDWKHSNFFLLDWITGLISRRPSSWNRVQHYGRIEREDGSISFDFIMFLRLLYVWSDDHRESFIVLNSARQDYARGISVHHSWRCSSCSSEASPPHEVLTWPVTGSQRCSCYNSQHGTQRKQQS